jgi:DNA-3-methyladenine glycosylase II
MSTRRSARLSAASGQRSVSASAMPPPPAPDRKPRKRKAESAAPTEQAEDAVPAAPSTPNKRRTTKAAPPPATPTPSNAKLIGEPASPSRGEPAKPAAVRRLANPDATNAPLLSPETSRLVAAKPIDLISPSKARMTTTTTTANLLEEANAFLVKADPRMKPLVEGNHCGVFSPEGLAEKIDPFESLCSGIMSQQVSGAAAKAIKKRFIELFEPAGPRFPHPSQVAECSVERLRSCGLSQRKAEYVSGLADKFVAGELSAQMLADAPYEEVLEKLTAVRGLGRWSVEMFACFALKRLDVFSLGDLGVQRGMAAFVGRDVAKLKNKGGKWKYMSEQEMTELSDKFKPYRSLFMWYMWRVEETDVSTME